jgi:hypothetical protein
MSIIKQTLKNALPKPVVDASRETLDAIRRLPEWPAANYHPWRRETNRRLQTLKDSRKGERCFIIGNGPSLRQTDLSRLKSEITFGMNRFYLAFPEIGFQTTYFVSVNDLVIEQCAADILGLSLPRFVSWRAHRWLKPADDLYFLNTSYTGPHFGGADITRRLWEGATVTYVALQVAYYLGFREAILIGVDHNFATKGIPNTTIVSQGDDPNHFNPAYFGKGFRWQLPDLDTSERGYWIARQSYEADGRKILDATVGGKLQVFPKVDYDHLF